MAMPIVPLPGPSRMRRAWTAFAEALAPIFDFMFPPSCFLCGATIAQQSGLCAGCWAGLVIPGEPACDTCMRPFDADGQHAVRCAPCLATPPRHDGIFAATLYNDASRRLILAVKYGAKLRLADMLSGQMAARTTPVGTDWLVVPVPLHRWRLWSRGYNQAAVLAAGIARRRGAKMVVDALLRRKRTPALGGLGAAARSRALRGAITVNPGRAALLRDAQVVLVDDVLTSGATSDACVAALKRAGARTVIVACYARVLDASLTDKGGLGGDGQAGSAYG